MSIGGSVFAGISQLTLLPLTMWGRVIVLMLA